MKAALVGNGIGKSLTPGMHEAEGAAQGLHYTYERFDTALPPWSRLSLAGIIERAEADGYAGLNVTHPHKMAVVGCLDRLSDASRALGSVNTVVFRDGQRIGHTTDHSGFREALNLHKLTTRGARVVQFGAGGAGSATALALIDAGARLTLVDQDAAKADALAGRLRMFRPQARIDTGAVDLALCDGAVNATPLGMDAYPGMAFDPADLRQGAWVADIVYFPLETRLTKAARERGLQVMNGGAMALFQAVGAFELITGRRADSQRMRASFHQLMAEREGRKSEAS